jgi:hypothetical protein
MSVPIIPQFAEETHTMLEAERARQERLKRELAASPVTRAWVEQERLMQNYKFLQFLDTLTLYFHLRHPGSRKEERYVHVPVDDKTDTEVTLQPDEEGVFSLNPFPFEGNRLEVVCRGRFLHPIPVGKEPADVGALLRGLPTVEQVITFVRA